VGMEPIHSEIYTWTRLPTSTADYGRGTTQFLEQSSGYSLSDRKPRWVKLQDPAPRLTDVIAL